MISRKSLELLPADENGRGTERDRDLERRWPSSGGSDRVDDEDDDSGVSTSSSSGPATLAVGEVGLCARRRSARE